MAYSIIFDRPQTTFTAWIRPGQLLTVILLWSSACCYSHKQDVYLQDQQAAELYKLSYADHCPGWTADGGKVHGIDRHMNLVLGDAEEFRKLPPKKGVSDTEREERRVLGLLLLRGDEIISLQIEGPPPADESRAKAAVAPAGPGTGRAAGRGLPVAAPGQPPAGLAGAPRGLGGPQPGMMLPRPQMQGAPVMRPPQAGGPPAQAPTGAPTGAPAGFPQPGGAPRPGGPPSFPQPGIRPGGPPPQFGGPPRPGMPPPPGMMMRPGMPPPGMPPPGGFRPGMPPPQGFSPGQFPPGQFPGGFPPRPGMPPPQGGPPRPFQGQYGPPQ